MLLFLIVPIKCDEASVCLFFVIKIRREFADWLFIGTKTPLLIHHSLTWLCTAHSATSECGAKTSKCDLDEKQSKTFSLKAHGMKS